jgi:hypothetical protein
LTTILSKLDDHSQQLDDRAAVLMCAERTNTSSLRWWSLVAMALAWKEHVKKVRFALKLATSGNGKWPNTKEISPVLKQHHNHSVDLLLTEMAVYRSSREYFFLVLLIFFGLYTMYRGYVSQLEVSDTAYISFPNGRR